MSYKAVEKCGDIIQVMLPLGSGIYALYQEDYEGFGYLAFALTVNQVCLETLKRFIPAVRPNGRHGSFPSGHTSAAFLGSTSLVARGYFPVISFPVVTSTVGAVGVAASRVLSKAHWVRDVIGGAVLGCAVSYFTIPKKA